MIMLITRDNAPALLREFADEIEKDQAKIRRIDFRPSIEIYDANPMTVPIPHLDADMIEKSTMIMELSIEIVDQKTVPKIKQILSR